MLQSHDHLRRSFLFIQYFVPSHRPKTIHSNLITTTQLVTQSDRFACACLPVSSPPPIQQTPSNNKTATTFSFLHREHFSPSPPANSAGTGAAPVMPINRVLYATLQAIVFAHILDAHIAVVLHARTGGRRRRVVVVSACSCAKCVCVCIYLHMECRVRVREIANRFRTSFTASAGKSHFHPDTSSPMININISFSRDPLQRACTQYEYICVLLSVTRYYTYMHTYIHTRTCCDLFHSEM